MDEVKFHGRVLYLSCNADVVRAQIAGKDFRRRDVGDLRDDISTDEITPVPILSHYDDALGLYPYSGFKAQNSFPVGKGDVRKGGFSVAVAGKRFGKGSSREHSPTAEKLAGIQLVIAESFERIYRQNADNIGLFTSTDFGLLARIEAGEAIAIDDLVKDRDALAAVILRAGGLLRFGQQSMKRIRPSQMQTADRSRTLFEKIVERHALKTESTPEHPKLGDGAFVRADWRFIHEYYTGMCAHMLHATFARPLALYQPASIIAFEDHTSYISESPAHLAGGLVPNIVSMCQAHRDFVAQYGLRSHRTLTDGEVKTDQGQNVAGISHAMMAEHYVLPGQLVVGTDSHTPHSGALGALAFGVGTTDMANAFVTGAVRMTMPGVLRVDLIGDLRPGVGAKDLVLHLLALPSIRSGAGIGKVFEFGGNVVRSLRVDERATLTNMTAELGGLTGMIEPDAETVRFLKERRGIDFEIEPWMHSDADAAYTQRLSLDCSELTPMVAKPGDPGNAVPLASLVERPKFDIAYGGSCTAGKREDFDRYFEVLHWAAERGQRIPPGLTLYLQYGTTAVRDYCQSQGYSEVFEKVGARILQPSCGACANCGPGSSVEAGQTTISAINRNFAGRSGPGQVWLASPATVAASAIAGELVSFEELQRREASQH